MKTNHKKPEEDFYKQAVHWQQRAEKYCSPAEFRIAADYYERAERYSEADYCRERATFYERAR